MTSNISRYAIFWNTSYNLTRKATKTEKLEKYLKMYIINFKTNHFKQTASSNIVHSVLNYKLMRPVSKIQLPKEQKQAKQQIHEKKLTEKCAEGKLIIKSNGIQFFINITSKNQQIWTNALEPRNFWENSYYQRLWIHLLSTEASKHAKLSLDGTTSLVSFHNSSIGPYNKLLTMKTTKKTGKNQKFSRKLAEQSRSNLNRQLFSESFLYDLLNVFPKRTISTRITWQDFKKIQK